MAIQVQIVRPLPTAFKIQMVMILVYFAAYWWLWSVLIDWKNYPLPYKPLAFIYYSSLIFPVELTKDIFLAVGAYTSERTSNVFLPVIFGGLSALLYIVIIQKVLDRTWNSRYKRYVAAILVVPGALWVVIGLVDWLLWNLFYIDLTFYI